MKIITDNGESFSGFAKRAIKKLMKEEGLLKMLKLNNENLPQEVDSLYNTITIEKRENKTKIIGKLELLYE